MCGTGILCYIRPQAITTCNPRLCTHPSIYPWQTCQRLTLHEWRACASKFSFSWHAFIFSWIVSQPLLNRRLSPRLALGVSRGGPQCFPLTAAPWRPTEWLFHPGRGRRGRGRGGGRWRSQGQLIFFFHEQWWYTGTGIGSCTDMYPIHGIICVMITMTIKFIGK